MDSNMKLNILITANQLFIENGYEGTTLALIASTLHIDIDTIRKYFLSKEHIVSVLIDMILEQIKYLMNQNIDSDISPLTYGAVFLRCQIEYLYHSNYHNLYIDLLRNEILCKILMNTKQYSLEKVLQRRNIELSEDYKLLYGILIPFALQKNLVLGYENHTYSQLNFEEISSYIFHTRFERWVSKEEIDQAYEKSKTMVRLVLDTAPTQMTNSQIKDWFEKLYE